MEQNREKKLLFIGFTVFLPVLLLTVVEFSLRLFFPSLQNPFVVEDNTNGTTSYTINQRYLEKYFPVNAPMVPELKPTTMTAKKSDRLIRIVCLGGSSMFGTPYQMTSTIPAIVQKQLRHIFPQNEIEVINLGAAAINSNVVLDLSKKILKFSPDIVLIYMGHNEYYGPDGVGASWLEKRFPSLIRLKYSLNDFALSGLVSAVLRLVNNSGHHDDINLMKQVSQQSTVRLDSKDDRWVVDNFKSNLSSIISLFQSHHVKIIISDVASNLIFSPFISDTSAGLKLRLHDLSRLHRAIDEHNVSQSYELASSLYTTDSSNAFIDYALGSAELALHKTERAKYHLQKARDEDLLKFRATSKINDIIRSTARRYNVPFVSTDSLFSSKSPDGIAGNNLFREHLHPNTLGYYYIATLFVEKIITTHDLPHLQSFTGLLPFDTDSLGIGWLDLAFGDIAIKQLTTHWPFLDYHARTDVMDTSDVELRKIATEVYARKISLVDGCNQSALYFRQHRQYDNALTTYMMLRDRYPEDYYAYYNTAVTYKEMGKFDKSVSWYTRTIEKDSSFVPAYVDLALLEINRGKLDNALSHLSKAEHLTRSDTENALVRATIFYGLSAIEANKNNFDQALHYINTSLQLAPAYQSAIVLRQKLMQFMHK